MVGEMLTEVCVISVESASNLQVSSLPVRVRYLIEWMMFPKVAVEQVKGPKADTCTGDPTGILVSLEK